MKCRRLVLLILLNAIITLGYGLSYTWQGIDVPENEYLWFLVLVMTILSFAVGRQCRQKVTSRVRMVPSGDVVLPLIVGVGLGLLILRWFNAKMFLQLTVGFTFPLSLLLLLLLVTSEDNKHISVG